MGHGGRSPVAGRLRSSRSILRAGGIRTTAAALLALSVLPLAVALSPTPAGAVSSPFTTWTSSVVDHQFPYQGSTSIAAVSCPSNTFCVAVDGLGNALVSTNPTGFANAWTSYDIDGSHALTAVSCPTTTFCIAVDGVGDIVASTNPSTGTSWAVVSPSSYTSNKWPFTTASCASTSFCMVGASNGDVFVTNASGPDTSLGWPTTGGPSANGAAVVDANASHAVTSLSCAADSHCAVVDNGGHGDTYNGAAWLNTTMGSAVNVGTAITSTSCTSTTSDLCVAVDSTGHPFYVTNFVLGTWNADGNAALTPAATAPGAISCPSTGLCVVVGQAGKASFTTAPTGASWTAVSAGVDTNAEGTATTILDGLSCPSTGLCVATDAVGNVWNSSTPNSSSTAWSEASAADGTNSLGSISCPSTTLCIAGDASGRITTSSNPSSSATAWSAPVTVDSLNPITAISCPSSTMCVAGDSADAGRLGNIVTSTNPTGGTSAWAAPVQIDSLSGITAISCPSTSLCVAVDTQGYVLYSTNPTGGSAAWQSAFIDNPGAVPIAHNRLSSISCPSTTLCVAADGAGYIFTSTTPAGGAATWFPWHVDGSNALNALACPSVFACIAVDSSAGPTGSVLYSTNPTGGLSSWHVIPGVDPAHAFSFVACPSTAVCLAVDTSGNVDASTNASGGPGAGVPPSWASVATTLNGTLGPIDSANAIQGLTCASATNCLGVDNTGSVLQGVTSSLSITTASLPSGIVKQPYTAAGQPVTIVATGGLQPYTWQITGSLPAGLTNSSGATSLTISGTPTAQGSTTFTVTATDSSSPAVSVSKNFTITVLAPFTTPTVVDCPHATTSAVCPSGDVAPNLGEPAADSSIALNAVSCFNFFSTTNYCDAVDALGRSFAYGGFSPPTTPWFPPAGIDSGSLTSDSCLNNSFAAFCVAVDSTGNAEVYTAGAWSTPTTVETGHTLSSVSCASASLCVAVDNAGNGYAFKGSSWVATTGNPFSANPVNSVSCQSNTVCMAVDNAGNAFEYNGSTWAHAWANPIDVGHSLVSVSCPFSETLCVAVDNNGGAFEYNGATWPADAGNPVSAHPLTSVSCADFTTTCVAGDNFGDAFGYNGTNWTALTTWTQPVDAGHAITSVSCATGTFCIATDGAGNAFAYNGSAAAPGQWTGNPPNTWTNPMDSTNQITALSCASTTLCVAGDSSGNIFSSLNAASNAMGSQGAWGQTGFTDLGHAVTGMACPSASLCVGVDNGGQVLSATSPSSSGWSAAGLDGVAAPQLHAVSCPSASLCIAVGYQDSNNNDLFYSTNPTGGPTQWTSLNIGVAHLTAIVCPTVTLCVAGDDAGQVVYSANPTGGASSWTFSTVDPILPGSVSNTINAISCPSTSLCVAVDSQGNVISSANPGGGGSTWSAAQVDANTSTTPPTPSSLTSVSCVTTLCMAGDVNGLAFGSSSPTAGASTWWSVHVDYQNSTTTVAWPNAPSYYSHASPALNAISCASASLCVAGDSSGMVTTANTTPSVSITTSSLAAGTVGKAYSATLTATGGSGTYSWSALTALPSGLSLSSGGAITGTPTAAGSFSFTVQVSDTSSPVQTASATLALTVGTATLSVTTTSLPSGTVGTAYSQTLAANGGTTPYTWSVQAGSSLPQGLTLSGAGAITGAPSGTGTTAFTVQVTDSSSPVQSATANLSITVAAATSLSITTTSLPAANVNASYSATLQASGGASPYSWAASQGTSPCNSSQVLPCGLSLAASGALSGTPTLSAHTETVTFTVTDSSAPVKTATATLQIVVQGGTPPSSLGYWMLAGNGEVFGFGASKPFGSAGGTQFLSAAGIAATADGGGYWVSDVGGNVQNFGDAAAHGSPGVAGVVGIAATSDSGGYWIATSLGGLYTEGDAGNFGSMIGTPLVQPVVGIAATPDGKGYWMVASDGGIFSFGDATFHGSMGGIRLNQPVVGIASTPDGGGYWEVASDGGIFTFGDARYFGSMGGIPLNQPVVGIAPSPDGFGYWMVARDGGIFSFGDATFQGSLGGTVIGSPIVGFTPF